MSLLKVDNDIKSKVDAFRERIKGEAEDLVANFFPRKLLELDNFLRDPCVNITELREIHSEINLTALTSPVLLGSNLDSDSNSDTDSDSTLLSHQRFTGVKQVKKIKIKKKVTGDDKTISGKKVSFMPSGMMKSNAKLVDLIEKVKPEIRTLIEKCNTVKMWVQLLIPKIEDGNNFGVSIQEETITELGVVGLEAESYLDQITKYYVTRANQMSKIVKYPQVEDYRRTVTETDEKEYISLKIIVSELRNYYITLHDMILKNIEKIKTPRSSNTDSLY